MRPESVDCTPPDYIMPDSKDRPLTALQPQLKDQKVPQCVKVSILRKNNVNFLIFEHVFFSFLGVNYLSLESSSWS